MTEALIKRQIDRKEPIAKMNKDLPLHERRVVYQIPGMDNVEVQRDLIYKRVEGTELKMDVYTPPGLPNDTRVPGVLFIHGGPIPSDFRPQLKDWGQYVSYGELIAASGLVGVTFNHRYHDFTQLDQSASDIAAAIRYVRDHAELFHFDSDRLCLWAISGGGPFLSFALRDKPTFVRCIVAYYASLDLRQSKEASAVVSEETLQKFSPVSYLSRSTSAGAPIFIARAGLDHPEFKQSIDLFLREALAANVVLDFANHHQGQHAFDILDDAARSRWIIARTIEFIKTYVQAD